MFAFIAYPKRFRPDDPRLNMTIAVFLESSNNIVLPFRGLAEGIIANETGFLDGLAIFSLLPRY